MDLCNKILSKAPLSWLDVQKQLLTAMQSRAGAGGGAGSVSSALQYAATSVSLMNASSVSANSSALPINKMFVKQCTDFLIKHIKSMRKTRQTPTSWALDRGRIISKQTKSLFVYLFSFKIVLISLRPKKPKRFMYINIFK